MPLCLVMHDLPEGALEALEAAVWELSESHCAIGSFLLVDTSVSADYLLLHLMKAARRAGLEGPLMVTPAGPELCHDGLSPEVVDWMRERIVSEAPAP